MIWFSSSLFTFVVNDCFLFLIFFFSDTSSGWFVIFFLKSNPSLLFFSPFISPSFDSVPKLLIFKSLPEFTLKSDFVFFFGGLNETVTEIFSVLIFFSELIDLTSFCPFSDINQFYQ